MSVPLNAKIMLFSSLTQEQTVNIAKFESENDVFLF